MSNKKPEIERYSNLRGVSIEEVSMMSKLPKDKGSTKPNPQEYK